MRTINTIKKLHFNQKITPENCYSISVNGCWNWKFGTYRGYGRVGARKWGHRLAHRWMYEFHKGKMPDRTELDHLCKNKICINPDHLEPVTHTENVRRGKQRSFTEFQVWFMRAAANKKVFSNGAIARIFDSNKTTIGRIISYKYYQLPLFS